MLLNMRKILKFKVRSNQEFSSRYKKTNHTSPLIPLSLNPSLIWFPEFAWPSPNPSSFLSIQPHFHVYSRTEGRSFHEFPYNSTRDIIFPQALRKSLMINFLEKRRLQRFLNYYPPFIITKNQTDQNFYTRKSRFDNNSFFFN